MLKKIIILILLFSLNTIYSYSYLNKESKIKIDNVSKVLFSKIENKYNLPQQKILLLKLNKKINKLKIDNSKNSNNTEILTYLQTSVVEKVKEVTLKIENPVVTKSTIVNKPTTVVNNTIITDKKTTVLKPSVTTEKPAVVDSSCNYNIHKDISASVFWV
jgi:hypothetical protein